MAGVISLLFSAFFFYIATAAIHWSRTETNAATTGTASQVSGLWFVLARSLIGFLFVLPLFKARFRENANPPPRASLVQSEGRRLFWTRVLLWGRAAGNFIAVVFFYIGVQTTTVGEANMLNMTYPVFVALLSVLFFAYRPGGMWREIPLPRLPAPATLAVSGLCFYGIYLVTDNSGPGFQPASLWALGSGLMAGFSILTLNFVRQFADTARVLRYVYTFAFLGCLVLIPLAGIIDPSILDISTFTPALIGWMFFSGLTGFTGQYLITWGFRRLSAVEGSILSSSRILIAALAGPVLFAAERYTARSLTGAAILFLANILVVGFQARSARGKSPES